MLEGFECQDFEEKDGKFKKEGTFKMKDFLDLIRSDELKVDTVEGGAVHATISPPADG